MNLKPGGGLITGVQSKPNAFVTIVPNKILTCEDSIQKLMEEGNKELDLMIARMKASSTSKKKQAPAAMDRNPIVGLKKECASNGSNVAGGRNQGSKVVYAASVEKEIDRNREEGVNRTPNAIIRMRLGTTLLVMQLPCLGAMVSWIRCNCVKVKFHKSYISSV